ncbi:MAG: hypothetical protein A3K12_03500 [Candidatus Rokubacteria bacterium RIFCSPLOWO2_12_FULL_71_19]|nr:MAG: hypothetical protein A3K12_03500 [Candidatus Rokubacteria bacterium RIFCSPLOWO2_12_FULL_71_19]
MASTREGPQRAAITSPRISSGVRTSSTAASTPSRASLACMVADRARELLVRKDTRRPCSLSSPSTSAAPGTRMSPVHTQPSRSKTKPRSARSSRRDMVM